MKYPNNKIYEKLYARFIDDDKTSHMIKQANLNYNSKVLDLCGGNGRLSYMCADIGCDVTLVDIEKDMLPEKCPGNMKVFKNDIFDFIIKEFDNRQKYDVIFCQQAINYFQGNYFDNIPTYLSEILNKNGVFIFNTFHNKPDKNGILRKYKFDKNEYIEYTYYKEIEDVIQHIQICVGMEPHMTEFYWLSPKWIQKKYSVFFDIELETNGVSDLYVCRKK